MPEAKVPEVKDAMIFMSLVVHQAHPKLIELLVWAVFIKGWPVVVTSFYRPDDAGVHGTEPVRGIDLRSYSFENPHAIAQEINDNWIYDNTRPDMNVCVFHDVGSGLHFHLQVHPWTEFVGDPQERWRIDEIRRRLV